MSICTGPSEASRAIVTLHSLRLAKTVPVVKVLAGLDAQTVIVPCTPAFGRVIAGVAAQRRNVGLSATPAPLNSGPAERPTGLPSS